MEYKYTPADFKSDQEVRWCPGCGDHAILNAVQRALPEIADALESIAHYSQAEQKQMIQQREMMREERKMLRKKGLLKNKDQFYVATVESVTADSDKETNVLICHDNGENITYLDMDNYIFIALPSGKPTPLSASYQSLPEAVAAYRKIVG